uniref:RUN domain-containing protein n=1 Tax=Heterorhabditis bacteriophora TaxID=37862 RepID=A0A1I7W6F0_HETBA
MSDSGELVVEQQLLRLVGYHLCGKYNYCLWEKLKDIAEALKCL